MTVSTLPPPPREQVDGAAAGRWRPTRAGITNVWRYYDEVFAFHRGRLLLRGPNGTGKSKALELLLPYLLDASLRPSRLSTFGGQERTMHWNLMGDGAGGKNRVGYVWVEFARPAGDGTEWFTVGARLQASVNSRQVQAAYFTTSQRVGADLALVGAGNRPLTRADLEETIGARGRVHATAADHRRAVMHTLYPGFDEDKYEALIGALLQLRTPKLSEHLDPGELSVLLSRSLPPLDQQAVAEIAEGFEKLDRRREDLAALERDVAVARRLADRQRRYAQRVVRAGAADLIAATSRMDQLTRRARESREAHAAALAEQRAAEERSRRLDDERLAKGERLEALKHSKAYTTHTTLAGLREHAARLRDHAATEHGRVESAEARLREDADALAALDAEVARLDAASGRAAGDAERAAGHAGLAAAFEEAAGADLDRARGLLDAAADTREAQVAEVRAAVDRHARAVARRDEEAARLERRRAAHDEAAAALDARRTERDAALEELQIALRTWAAGCEELPLMDALDDLEEAAADEADVLALVAAAASAAERSLAEARAGCTARRDALVAERERVATERECVAAEPEVAPDPPASRTAERDGRTGAPLWRLVTFADDVDARAQAAVEAALEDAGLLDAWVDADGRLTVADAARTLGGHDRFTAPELGAPAPGPSLADVLAPEPDPAVPAERVRALLAAIAYGPTASEHVAAVGGDGTWRLAALAGSWTKPEPEFVGATARERARQRRLAELDARLAELDADLAAVHAELETLAARGGRLAEEQQARPAHTALRAADEAVTQAEATQRSRADAVAETEAELRAAEREATEALRQLAALASEHRLPTGAADLDELAGALRAFRRAGEAWVGARRRRADAGRRREQAASIAERSERDAAAARDAAENADREARKLSLRLESLQAKVGADVQQVLDEVHALEARLGAIDGERRAVERALRDLAGRVGELKHTMEVDEDARDDAAAARDAAAQAFRRLGVVGLAAEAGHDADLAALDGVRPTLDAARRIAADWADVPYEPRQVKEAEARVAETVHEVRQALAGRADVALEPDEDGRSVLVAAVDGLRLGARALHERLQGELAAARTELTATEQELFDRTLRGEARRQVAERIRQARGLVDQMNALLQRVETASHMRVRLRWHVDPDLPAGTREARGLILRDFDDLSEADQQALHEFFRARVEEVRAADTATGWEEQLLEVLDYRAWHVFVAEIDRGDGRWQPVTRRTHGQLSGGERAIALHLPLFAAAAAHYAAAKEHAPRLVLLDEVFVGVDAANRGQLLDLLVRLDLDAVMTSDHEWCTYTELDGIAVHQLITGTDGDDAVTTARFVWDGNRLLPSEPDEPVLPLEPAHA